MKRMVWIGVLAVVASVACGSEESAPSEPAATTTGAPSATSEPSSPTTGTVVVPSPAEAPSEDVPSAAAPTPQAALPAPLSEPLPAPDAIPPLASDMPTGDALYLDICQRFLPAIDALESSGVTGREEAVTGMSGEMTASPSWSTVPPDDQQQSLRGLQAAGAGAC